MVFFNFLTIILGLLVIDDNFWIGKPFLQSFQFHILEMPKHDWTVFFYLMLFLLIMILSIDLFNRAFRTIIFDSPEWIHYLHICLNPFHVVNPFGLFAVMTTKRIELIIDGSNDGENWLAYEFKYKPGNINRRPPFIPGHMPRLDWQIWFCAFGTFPTIPNWLLRFLDQIWKDNKNVLSLLEFVPFQEAPKYLRIQRYLYTFTTREELEKTGKWWNRNWAGKYIPFIIQNPKYESFD